jgi:hypothetical protein
MRHPSNATNYQRLEKLLEMSLRSVCNQVDERYRVVVVCNKVPQISFVHPNIHYHLVDFPSPSKEGMPVSDIYVGMRDKGTRILSGVLYARRFEPTHVAFFDADDLISCRVAQFINSNPQSPGWYVDAGYTLDYTSRSVQRKHGLFRYCGTVLVTRVDYLMKASRIQGIDENSSQDELLQIMPLNIIKYIYGDHRCMVRFLDDRLGVQIKPFPFRAATWVLRTGENFTKLNKPLGGIPIPKSFSSEFGLMETEKTDSSPTFLTYLHESFQSFRSQIGSIGYRLKGFPNLPAT